MNKRIAFILLSILLHGCAEPEPPKPSIGEQLYIQYCKVCHAQGINGAPIVGNQKMWAARSQQPLDTLVSHASEGFGLMPAKGGNPELNDDQLRTIISYMLSQLEKP